MLPALFSCSSWSLSESGLERLELTVVSRGGKLQKMSDEVVHIDVLKRLEANSLTNVRTGSEKDCLHLGDLSRIVPMLADLGRPGIGMFGINASTERIRRLKAR